MKMNKKYDLRRRVWWPILFGVGLGGQAQATPLSQLYRKVPMPLLKAPQPAPAYDCLKDLPERPDGALTGSAFLASIRLQRELMREEMIIHQVLAGNVPTFLRQPRRVTIAGGDGVTEVAIFVTPDYLAIGSDSDYARIPVTGATALFLARYLGCYMPTPKMVDAIYEAADVHFRPKGLKMSRYGQGTLGYMAHRRYLWQFESVSDALSAGQKKDIVVTGQLFKRPKPARVAIYGWHQPDYKPIQPLSLVHHQHYVDYSHGLRLIYEQVEVAGQRMPLREALADRKLARLLSREAHIAEVYARLFVPVERAIALNQQNPKAGSRHP